MITNLDSNNFDDFINSFELVAVDFYSQACRPCQIMEPVIFNVATNLQGRVLFARIDALKHFSQGIKYDILALPTIVLFKNGVLIKTIIGIHTPASLTTEIFSD